MNDWNNINLAEQVRRGNNRSQLDQIVSACVGGGIMVGTLVASVVLLFKTGSLIVSGICLLAGLGGIVGFGAVFWRDKS